MACRAVVPPRRDEGGRDGVTLQFKARQGGAVSLCHAERSREISRFCSVSIESGVNSECDVTIGPVRDVSTPLGMT